MTSTKNVMDFFPLPTPRKSQKGVIEAIANAFETYDCVILEAPVGEGKSAIAVTLSKYFGKAHILTPRKALQDQYMEDFQSFGLRPMKGKSSYPCTPDLDGFATPMGLHSAVTKGIQDGEWDLVKIVGDPAFRTVSKGACIRGGKINKSLANQCQQIFEGSEPGRPCPFVTAVVTARGAEVAVHNLHSFLFQNFYGKYFDQAELLIVDEAHDLEGIVRDFVAKSFNLPVVLSEFTPTVPHIGLWPTYIRTVAMAMGSELGDDDESASVVNSAAETLIASLRDTYAPRTNGLDEWVYYFREVMIAVEGDPHTQREHNDLRMRLVDRVHRTLSAEVPSPEADILEWANFLKHPEFVPGEHEPEEREKYLEKVEFLVAVSDTFLSDRVVFIEEVPERGISKVTFMPVDMGSAPANLFFQYGKKQLLMSGTIYDRDYFCKKLGIPKEKTAFIRLNSGFPIATRPIIADPRLMTINSHAKWRDDPLEYQRMLSNIKRVLDAHPTEKGLIHAPSYFLADKLINDMGLRRLHHHTAENFQEKLAEFYTKTGNEVFVSPVCQQGVDFKDDRARFQIVIRVPYANTSDPFVEQMMKKDYPWYNYQSLIVFGQMMGRVNRSPTDFGVTYLLDKRFQRYLAQNKTLLQAWLLAAVSGKAPWL